MTQMQGVYHLTRNAATERCGFLLGPRDAVEAVEVESHLGKDIWRVTITCDTPRWDDVLTWKPMFGSQVDRVETI